MSTMYAKAKVMSLRLTAEQWERLQEATKTGRHRTPSAWVRELVNLNLGTLFEMKSGPAPQPAPFQPMKRRTQMQKRIRTRKRKVLRTRRAKKPSRRSA